MSLIEGCTFTNCTSNFNGAGGLTIDTVYPFTVRNCTFRGNQAAKVNSDTAASAVYSYGGITSSPENSLTLENCVFERNSGSYGGAVNVNGKVLNITGCSFYYNEATNYGGAVYVKSQYNEGSQLTIESSLFYSNTATYGGGLYVKDQVLTTTITNTTIDNNSSTFGGGVYIGGTIEIFDCLIVDNVGSNAGGGIALADGSDLTIVRGTFLYNGSDKGAGLQSSGSTITATAVGFLSNFGIGDGGALCLDGGAFTGEYLLFSANVADRGGGFYSDDSSVATVEKSVFFANWGYVTGGAFECEGESVTLTDSVLRNNWAPVGPDFACADGCTTLLTNVNGYNSSDVSGCTAPAAVRGGGVAWKDMVTLAEEIVSQLPNPEYFNDLVGQLLA